MMNHRKFAAASKGRLILRYSTADKPEPIHPPTLGEAGCATRTQHVRPPARPAVAAGVIGDEPPAFLEPIARTKCEGCRNVMLVRGAPRRHRRALVGAQAQAQRLRPSILAARVGQPRQRVRSNAGRDAAIWNAVDRARWLRPRRRWLDQLPPSYRAADAADPGRAGGQTYLFGAAVAGDPHMHVHIFW
jgi:hypothetical protein